MLLARSITHSRCATRTDAAQAHPISALHARIPATPSGRPPRCGLDANCVVREAPEAHCGGFGVLLDAPLSRVLGLRSPAGSMAPHTTTSRRSIRLRICALQATSARPATPPPEPPSCCPSGHVHKGASLWESSHEGACWSVLLTHIGVDRRRAFRAFLQHLVRWPPLTDDTCPMLCLLASTSLNCPLAHYGSPLPASSRRRPPHRLESKEGGLIGCSRSRRPRRHFRSNRA